jgi:hypothetical protein
MEHPIARIKLLSMMDQKPCVLQLNILVKLDLSVELKLGKVAGF